jgi:hypothetical protein
MGSYEVWMVLVTVASYKRVVGNLPLRCSSPLLRTIPASPLAVHKLTFDCALGGCVTICRWHDVHI